MSKTVAGNLGAQREAAGSRFFGRKIKNAGSAVLAESLVPMSKPRLAQTDAQIGSLPSGGNTVGGVVGGLNEEFHRVKAGRS